MPGTGGVLVRAHHRRIDRNRPGGALFRVGSTTQLNQNPLPGAIAGPAAMPVVDGLPVPVLRWQVTPRHPTPRPPEHPVQHLPMISPTATAARRPVRQQRLQPSPLRIGQIMTIKHPSELPHPPALIHGTRPSPGLVAGVAYAGLGSDHELGTGRRGRPPRKLAQSARDFLILLKLGSVRTSDAAV